MAFLCGMNVPDLPTLTAGAVALLNRLIATPSLSREEAQTADLIATYLAQQGVVANRAEIGRAHV